MSTVSPCGRTNVRIRGWMGRADQTTKVRGMFVRAGASVAEVLRRHPQVKRARLVVEGEMANDRMTLKAEVDGEPAGLAAALAEAIRDVTKLRGEVELVDPGTLPNDGKVIEDARKYVTDEPARRGRRMHAATGMGRDACSPAELPSARVVSGSTSLVAIALMRPRPANPKWKSSTTTTSCCCRANARVESRTRVRPVGRIRRPALPHSAGGAGQHEDRGRRDVSARWLAANGYFYMHAPLRRRQRRVRAGDARAGAVRVDLAGRQAGGLSRPSMRWPPSGLGADYITIDIAHGHADSGART
jgi:hypothetical protein